MTRKEEIINTTIKLLSDETIDCLSIEKIALNCNLSKSTLYHYFNSKEDLYKNVLTKIIKNDYKSIKKIEQLEVSNIDKIKLIIMYFFNRSFNEVKIMDIEIYSKYSVNFSEEQFIHFNEVLELWNRLFELENIDTNSRLIFDMVLASSKNNIFKEKFNKITKIDNIKTLKCSYEESKEEIITGILDIINMLKREENK